MFEHADRHDPVKLARLFSVVAQTKTCAIGKARSDRAPFRYLVLLDAQGDTGNISAGLLGQI